MSDFKKLLVEKVNSLDDIYLKDRLRENNKNKQRNKKKNENEKEGNVKNKKQILKKEGPHLDIKI